MTAWLRSWKSEAMIWGFGCWICCYCQQGRSRGVTTISEFKLLHSTCIILLQCLQAPSVLLKHFQEKCHSTTPSPACNLAFRKCSFVCFSFFKPSLDTDGRKQESAFSSIEKSLRSPVRGSKSYAPLILTDKVGTERIFFSRTDLAECAGLLAFFFFSSIFFTKGNVQKWM